MIICTSTLAWRIRETIDVSGLAVSIGQFLLQKPGQTNRFQIRYANANDNHFRAAMTESVAITNFLPQGHARPLGRQGRYGDVHLLIESGRTKIVDGNATHDEHQTGFGHQLILLDPQTPQPFRARSLEQVEIACVIDHTARIGIFVIHPNGPEKLAQALFPSLPSHIGRKNATNISESWGMS